MLEKEPILKVLKKYGFYSLNRAPFLYQSDGRWGVYFTWQNIHYGNLERVLFFNNEQELEEEIFKYWWFLNNKDKMDITVLFDNYETLSPKVTYSIDNQILNVDWMKNYHTYNEEQSLKAENEKIKVHLLRTSNILISILCEKFKNQNTTYFEVSKKQEELKKLTNIFNNKLNQYNNFKDSTIEMNELLLDDTDESNNLAVAFRERLAFLDTVSELKDFINNLFSYLKSVDLNEINLQNVYLLNRYSLEINDLEKKIIIVENALNAKKKKFKGKQNIEILLQSVDNSSECRNLMPVEQFVEIEKKKIEDKYKDCGMISEFDLGDYLVNLENLNIEIPPKIIDGKKEVKVSREDLLNMLKSQYENLTKEEQSACHIAMSFMKNCVNSLLDISNLEMLSINEIINQLILNKRIDNFNDAYSLLDNYLNAKVRVKYLSILRMENFEDFLKSLIDSVQILKRMKIKLEHSFTGYYNSREDSVLPINLKNLCFLEHSISYVGNIMPNVPIYYSPVQIVKSLDIDNLEELTARENAMVFLIKDSIQINTEDNPVLVVKYEKDNVVKNDDFTVIMNMKEKSRCQYYNDNISLKERDEIK